MKTKHKKLNLHNIHLSPNLNTLNKAKLKSASDSWKTQWNLILIPQIQIPTIDTGENLNSSPLIVKMINDHRLHLDLQWVPNIAPKKWAIRPVDKTETTNAILGISENWSD